ncbi:hypothetical protein Tsubulata_048326, partial [Turnera subulata]
MFGVIGLQIREKKICSVVIAAWVCWVLVVGTRRVCSSPAGSMLSERCSRQGKTGQGTTNKTITLVLSMNDLYLLGFHSSPAATNNAYYYFNDCDDTPGAASLFPRASAVSLGYDASYAKGLARRDAVSLGNEPLYCAIKTLYQRQGIPSNWKKSLIVVIQMMLEA